MQTSRPTTTVARFVMANSGHVFDLNVDSPGSVARAVSNTTIPGIAQVVWGARGASALLQYFDDERVKTASLLFPVATSSASSSLARPVRIQFLPDNITDAALSPDGASVAYLLKSAAGADGYTTLLSGTGGKKLFSFPLSQVLISWPSPNTLLLVSASAAGVPGVAFSIDSKAGATSPILYTEGLTAIADKAFARVVYQSASSAAGRHTYLHDTKTGRDVALSFDPAPEKCRWSEGFANVLYCATPISYVGQDYLDLWHQGRASISDSIVAFDLVRGITEILAAPGGAGGGEASDIAEFAVSADDHYLLFIKKVDRSLWAIRLRQ